MFESSSERRRAAQPVSSETVEMLELVVGCSGFALEEIHYKKLSQKMYLWWPYSWAKFILVELQFQTSIPG